MILGIDPGIHGGFCVIDKDGNVLNKSIMPTKKIVVNKAGKKRNTYDMKAIYDLLKSYANVQIAFIEYQQPYHNNGVLQAFKTGGGYHLLQMGLIANGIEYQIVKPKIWQKAILPENNDSKAASQDYAIGQLPDEDWTKSERARIPHDGLTDAYCIARYGLANYNNI